MAVFPHPLLTPDSNLLRVKVNKYSVWGSKPFLSSDQRTRILIHFSFLYNSDLQVAWWCHRGTTHPSPFLPLLRISPFHSQILIEILLSWEDQDILCDQVSGFSTPVKSNGLWLPSQVRQANGPFWFPVASYVVLMLFCGCCSVGPWAWSLWGCVEGKPGWVTQRCHSQGDVPTREGSPQGEGAGCNGSKCPNILPRGLPRAWGFCALKSHLRFPLGEQDGFSELFSNCSRAHVSAECEMDCLHVEFLQTPVMFS